MIHLVVMEALTNPTSKLHTEARMSQWTAVSGGKHFKTRTQGGRATNKSAHPQGKTIQGHCSRVSESCQRSSTGVASCTRDNQPLILPPMFTQRIGLPAKG